MYTANEEVQVYMLAFQQGEEKGFTYFFNLLYPSLVYYAFRILKDRQAAEDVVEDAFIKIWERHSTFTNSQAIKPWLYTVARNMCLDRLRKEKSSRRYKEAMSFQGKNSFQESSLNDIIHAEIINEIHSTINSLPTECRKIFQMIYIQGKTVREIADELQLSISTIKNQKARGLSILRKKFPNLVMLAVLEAMAA